MFNAIMKVFGYPLGWLMWALYQLITNYGVALILFTVIVKLLLFPLGLKQQKSTIKMQMIQPKMREIQAKYKNNPQKQNEELSALYEKEHYSPMSGCWPTLVQFVFLFGLLDVVYRPMTHLLRLSNEVVDKLTAIGTELGVLGNTARYAPQITLYQSIKTDPTAYAAVGADVIEKIQGMNMNFFGLDMGQTPNLPWQGGWNWLVVVPLLSGAFALLSSVLSMRNNPSMDGQTGMSMKMMMYTMPLLSVWIAFSVPVGVGIYWALSSLLGCVQIIILNKLYNPKEVAERLKAEEKERAERERQERIESKKRAKEALKNGEKVEDTTYLSDKEKIKEARRRYAERYGDSYGDD